MGEEKVGGEKTDARRDMWAVGAVLYEVATSQRPFSEELSTRLTDAILHQPPPSPRSLNAAIPAELERIILKCLDKDPENRYQSATEFVVDLRRLEATSTAVAVASPSRRRSRRWLVLPIGGGFVFSGFGAPLIFLARPSRQTEVGGAPPGLGQPFHIIHAVR